MFILASTLLLGRAILSGIRVMVVSSGEEYGIEWEAFNIRGVKVVLFILVDYIRLLFFRTVIMISGSVILYSSSYIIGDPFSSRFCLLVINFVLRIGLLIFSPRLISILLGWDGLGVTSYLLVCYYRREKRFNASMLTALTNRLGDVAILILIGFWARHGLYNYSLVRSGRNLERVLLFYLIIVAGITKRAQIPFSAWLPAAMAAPTPVSALVHSSTLVTAGVYLILRNNYIIVARGWAARLLFIGLITITMAGAAALFEVDIKKVIALSTLRQLGVIFFSLGLGQPFLAFLHLISHAYFKAMLFIAAGAIIHSLKDYQDLRKIGGRIWNVPGLSAVILIRNLSLCGIPFLSGFYSKDMILEMILMDELNLVVLPISLLATALTVIYSCRLTLGLFGEERIRESYRIEGDCRIIMGIRMRVLILPSIIGGWFLRGFIGSRVLVYLRLIQKLFIIMIVAGLGLACMVVKTIKFNSNTKISNLIHQMWFIPLLFRVKLTREGLYAAKDSTKASDLSWIERITWVWVVIYNRVQESYFFSGNRQNIIAGALIIIIVFLLI